MYTSPNLSVGGSCFITAPKNSMLLPSAHIFSPLSTMQVNPFLPSRSVVLFPSVSMRTTAASFATALGAADKACAMYSASADFVFFCAGATLASNRGTTATTKRLLKLCIVSPDLGEIFGAPGNPRHFTARRSVVKNYDRLWNQPLRNWNPGGPYFRSADFCFAQPSFTTWRPRPIASDSSGTSSVMHEAAPM